MRLKRWNKIILISFLFAHTYIFSQDTSTPKSSNYKDALYWKKEAERLKFENEDALMEIQVKELQREIEQEKVEILTKERVVPDKSYHAKVQKKKNRTLQNILLPGLGSINNGEKGRGMLTMSIFGFLVFSTYINFQHTNSISNQIHSLFYFEFLELARLNHEYKVSYAKTNLFLFGTIAFYLLNLFESNSWEENTSQFFLPKYPVISMSTSFSNSSYSEKKILIHWQIYF
jgi:hypothetical protein